VEWDGHPGALNSRMARRNALMLTALALIWGASFMFIKIADRQLAPATLILGRIGLAALTLALTAPRGTISALRDNARWLVVVGLVNTAIPFWLLSWGETRIQSGLASIIQAAVPIFNAALAFAFFRELRVTGIRLVGVAVGFVGVALLVGAQPEGKVLGAVAVVGMALCYGAGGLLASRHLREVPAHVVALGTTVVAATVAAPAGIVQAPHDVPSWKTFASIAVLGIVGTALAYLLFFALIASAGSGYASLVTYLVPPIALGYGAVFLGERFGATAFAALAIVLAGVALGTGGFRLARRRSVASEA
jgi:drug/metabolite transporter (DMT)-like permease